MQQKDHWEAIYTAKAPDEVSWYQPHVDGALRLIRDGSVTSLDVTGAALAAAIERLGPRASRVPLQPGRARCGARTSCHIA